MAGAIQKLLLALAMTAMTVLTFNKPVHGCSIMADIAFIIDTSSSVTKEDFNDAKEFAAKLASDFPLGPHAARFAAIVYGDQPSTQFSFEAHSRTADLTRDIRNLRYIGGRTHTGTALRAAWNGLFSSPRNLASKIIIVITDGKASPSDDYDYEEQANILEQQGYTVIAIGVGKADRSQLNNIASSDKYVFMSPTYKALGTVRKAISNYICIEPPPTGKEVLPPSTKNGGNKEGNKETGCNGGDGSGGNGNGGSGGNGNGGNGNGGSSPGGNCINSCYNKPTGDYAACAPKCKEGYYISCVDGQMHMRPCQEGWYVDRNNRRVSARLVYNPITKSCQQSVPSCPRDLEDILKTTSGGSGNNNGDPEGPDTDDLGTPEPEDLKF